MDVMSSRPDRMNFLPRRSSRTIKCTCSSCELFLWGCTYWKQHWWSIVMLTLGRYDWHCCTDMTEVLKRSWRYISRCTYLTGYVKKTHHTAKINRTCSLFDHFLCMLLHTLTWLHFIGSGVVFTALYLIYSYSYRSFGSLAKKRLSYEIVSILWGILLKH